MELAFGRSRVLGSAPSVYTTGLPVLGALPTRMGISPLRAEECHPGTQPPWAQPDGGNTAPWFNPPVDMTRIQTDTTWDPAQPPVSVGHSDRR